MTEDGIRSALMNLEAKRDDLILSRDRGALSPAAAAVLEQTERRIAELEALLPKPAAPPAAAPKTRKRSSSTSSEG